MCYPKEKSKKHCHIFQRIDLLAWWQSKDVKEVRIKEFGGFFVHKRGENVYGDFLLHRFVKCAEQV